MSRYVLSHCVHTVFKNSSTKSCHLHNVHSEIFIKWPKSSKCCILGACLDCETNILFVKSTCICTLDLIIFRGSKQAINLPSGIILFLLRCSMSETRSRIVRFLYDRSDSVQCIEKFQPYLSSLSTNFFVKIPS
jgi:hypothetical protein